MLRHTFFKRLLVTFFLLSCIGLGVPWGLGVLARRQTQRIVAYLGRVAGFTTQLVDYQRGWLTSKGRIELFQPERPYRLILSVKIFHGPVFLSWSRIHFVRAVVQGVVQLAYGQGDNLAVSSVQMAPQFTVRAEWDGTLRGKFSCRSFLFKVPAAYFKGTTPDFIKFNNCDGEISYSLAEQRCSVKMKLAGFDALIGGDQFQLANLKLQGRGECLSQFAHSWLLNGSLWIDAGGFATARPHRLIFKNFGLNYQTTLQPDGKISLTIDAEDNLFKINEQSYRRNYLSIAFTQLSGEAFYQLQRQLSIATLFCFSKREWLMTLFPLLASGATCHLTRCSSNTPWGKLSLNLAIQPRGDLPGGWFGALISSESKINLAVDQALLLHLVEKFYDLRLGNNEGLTNAQRAQQLFADWLQQGYLQQSSIAQLQVGLQYRAGELLINGKPAVISIKL